MKSKGKNITNVNKFPCSVDMNNKNLYTRLLISLRFLNGDGLTSITSTSSASVVSVGLSSLSWPCAECGVWRYLESALYMELVPPTKFKRSLWSALLLSFPSCLLLLFSNTSSVREWVGDFAPELVGDLVPELVGDFDFERLRSLMVMDSFLETLSIVI